MQKIDRTGETNIANNGMEMTIIAYRGCDDIDIQFEDGTIVFNKRYSTFKNNTIGHPTIKAERKIAARHIGETNIAKNGMKMTIIAYRNFFDIDVQFEDKTVICNKLYANFKKGRIGYPTSKQHIGETSLTTCGLKATIIKYNNTNDIDIQFENNIVIHNKRYVRFKKGNIKMPNIINTIKLKEFAYKFNNDWYYICSHPTWTENKILSVKEIYAYTSN